LAEKVSILSNQGSCSKLETEDAERLDSVSRKLSQSFLIKVVVLNTLECLIRFYLPNGEEEMSQSFLIKVVVLNDDTCGAHVHVSRASQSFLIKVVVLNYIAVKECKNLTHELQTITSQSFLIKVVVLNMENGG